MDENLSKILNFIHETEALKDVHRSGKTSGGSQESTAEHSWRLALFALMMLDHFPGLDREKVLALCLVHDLGEIYEGDIPAVEQVSETTKQTKEARAIEKLRAILPQERGRYLVSLWEEYEIGESAEAKLVKALDKMETIVQHNQGDNGPAFDYGFNLDYGKALVKDDDVLTRLRAMVDEGTKRRMERLRRDR